MNSVSLSALSLLATECLTMHFMIKAVWFPLFAVGLGIMGSYLPKRYYLNHTWAKRSAILLIGIGIIRLLLMNRNTSQETIPEYANLFGSYDTSYWIAQISIGLQLILLFTGFMNHISLERKAILSRAGIPSLFFFTAVTGQVCVMNRIAEYSKQNIMMNLSVLFMILSALFIITCSAIPNPSISYRKSFSYRAVSMLSLAISALSSIFAVTFIQNNQKELDALFFSSFAGQKGDMIGFSRKSSLGNLLLAKRITPDVVALRVIADDAPGYLRGFVYDQYDRNAWYSNQEKTTVLPSNRKIADGFDPKDNAVFELNPTAEPPHMIQEIWPDGATQSILFTSLNTAWISLPAQSIQIDSAKVAEIQSSPIPKSYRNFLVPQMPASPLPEALRRKCLSIPPMFDPKIHDLARTLTEGCFTNTQKAAAISRYFTTEYQYSLRVNIPAGMEPLNYFILNKPAAHCEFFASAAVILLRMVDVPCRYVNGFVVTQRSSFADYWIAYNHDAHAWVEAYDENNGWFIVEATPTDGRPNTNDTLNFRDFWNALIFKGPGIMQWLHTLKTLILWPVTAWKTIIFIVAMLLIWQFIRKYPQQRIGTSFSGKMNVHAMNTMLVTMDQRAKAKGFVRARHETIHHFSMRLREKENSGSVNKTLPPHEEAWLNAASDWYLRYARIRYCVLSNEKECEILKNTMPGQSD